MKERLAILGRLGVGVARDLERSFDVIEESLRIVKWHGLGTEPRIAVEEARDAIRRANRLTQCLLGHAGRARSEPTSVDLAALLQRVLDCFGGVLGNGVQLVVDVSDDVPPVHGVAEDLELLVLDVLLHAADRVDERGYVLVSLRREDPSTVVVEVAHSDDHAGDEQAPPSGPLLGVALTIAERHGARLRNLPRAGGGERSIIAFALDDAR
ncbi:MAG TPA: hypothetical protein VFG69_16070 [Nannocystaceae bacterium]|nr:hypothetical protein [Nannocystaceae bacterium]